MKRYVIVLGSLIAMLIGYRLLSPIFPKSLNIILWALLLIVFGTLMSPTKGRSNRWIGKVIVSVWMLCVLGSQLGILHIPYMDVILPYADFMYIYGGWSFYQV